MINRGTVRADGKVFWAYKSRNGKKFECWVTPEQLKKWDEGRRRYVQAKRAEYLDQQSKLPPEERNHFGKYNPENGLYFIKVGTNGKPMWGNLEKLQKYKKALIDNDAKYRKNLKDNLPPPSVCVGDKHPTDNNLYVIRIWSNKVYYGTLEKLNSRRQKSVESGRLYSAKNREAIRTRALNKRKKLREFLAENPHLKFSRGDVDPITNQFFWGYSCIGKEVWLDQETFKNRRNTHNEKRRKYHSAERKSN
jgi:hypothetical protein